MTVKDLPISIGFKEIVFASDFEYDTLGGYEHIVKFARKIDSKLHLLFINTPTNFTETEIFNQNVKPFIEKADGLVEEITVYNCYDFESGLGNIIKKHGDLLAMVTHGAKGSLTEHIVNHIDIPVLSVNSLRYR